MEELSVIGIDLAKTVFEVRALSASGEVVATKRLKRAAFWKFMETAPRCLVGMEARGGAHHWGRRFEALGFTVKLMAPRPIQACRQGPHKNDARDAAAIAEAASRPRIAAVRVKSEAAQLLQGLARVRTRRARQLTATLNQLRGLLNEFGLIAPKGRARLIAAVATMKADKAPPEASAPVIDDLLAEIARQAAAFAAATKTLVARVKDDETGMRLMTIPAIGPINAATLSVALEAPQDFDRGRAFAAHLGLVPRQIMSAGKERKAGVIRQRGNQTRVHLVLAAQSLITAVRRRKEPPTDKFLLWAHTLSQRKHRNVAAVAAAGKLSRIAFAVTAGRVDYAPRSANA